MNTMSESATRLQPSPTAGPFTAATIGRRHRTMPVTIWRPWAIVVLLSDVVPCQLVEVAEVTAGGEGAARPGEHGDPGPVVGVELWKQRGETGMERVVGGVELFGAVAA